MLRKSLFFASFFILSFGASSAALADEGSSSDATERVEVTGSHIKRTDTEGVAPVQTVSRQEIEKKGYDTMGDVVRDIGANSFGSSNFPTGNSTAPGVADISLRGLGSDNTLVLLNGQRLPQDAITGSVDVNLIPLVAVERIEILKDGASAIYGSDALGGVVNIITKKDFQGTQVALTQSIPTDYAGGKQTQVSLVNGINGEKLNIVTTAQFLYNQAINSRDRPWSNNNFSETGVPASYANIDGSGNINAFMTQNCPANLMFSDGTNTFCRFKYSDYSEETPQLTQVQGMTEAHYELSSSVRLRARFSGVYRDAIEIAAPAPGNVTLSPSQAAVFNPTGYASGDQLYVQVRLAALGPRITDVTTNALGGLLGATVQLPSDWALDFDWTLNQVSNRSTGTNGFALKDKVRSLIGSGSYNPFVLSGGGSLASAGYQPTEDSRTLMSSAETKVSGDLFETSAGPVGLAIGSLVNYSTYLDKTDAQTLANNVFGDAGGSGDGHRTAEALYAELSVPVVKKKLDLQLAGRFDHFSDFGSTVNPKLGILYHPASDWLLRGTVGTGFRAPLLTELYAGPSIGYPSFIDHVGCSSNPSACSAAQYQVTSGGNPGLKQETSVSYTLGTVYAPTPSANVGMDWYYTKINNMPGIDYNDMTLAQSMGVDPSKYGVIITRDTTNQILSVVAPLQNLSSVQELGTDITGSVAYKKFKLSTEQDQLFFYRASGFPGVPLTDKLGWYGNPRWRNTSVLDYGITENQDASITSHTIARQKMLDQTGYISPMTTFDLSYTYKNKVLGEFSLSVINVLGTLPPYDSSQPDTMVNYGLYDPNGRTVVLGYKRML